MLWHSLSSFQRIICLTKIILGKIIFLIIQKIKSLFTIFDPTVILPYDCFSYKSKFRLTTKPKGEDFLTKPLPSVLLLLDSISAEGACRRDGPPPRPACQRSAAARSLQAAVPQAQAQIPPQTQAFPARWGLPPPSPQPAPIRWELSLPHSLPYISRWGILPFSFPFGVAGGRCTATPAPQQPPAPDTVPAAG